MNNLRLWGSECLWAILTPRRPCATASLILLLGHAINLHKREQTQTPANPAA